MKNQVQEADFSRSLYFLVYLLNGRMSAQVTVSSLPRQEGLCFLFITVLFLQFRGGGSFHFSLKGDKFTFSTLKDPKHFRVSENYPECICVPRRGSFNSCSIVW